LATPEILSFASFADDPLAAVPESSTWVMMFLGFAGLGWLTCAGASLRRVDAV
jgi:hypothetical protein